MTRKTASPSKSSANGAGAVRKTRAQAKKETAAAGPAHPETPKKRSLPDEMLDDQVPASKRKKEADSPIPTIEGVPADHVPTTPPNPQQPASPRFSPPSEPANDNDKKNWKGFCEIESDPDQMSAMIRMMGVQGVTVQQAFSPDSTMLAEMANPIHGLIFLYRYRSTGASKQAAECPEDVWFANQLAGHNSCSTLAVMNILMNATDVELGENLQQFKGYSAGLMTPRLRGDAFGNFEFVKSIHNSFAKKMDMLENDQHIADKASTPRKSRKTKAPADESSDDADDNFETNACHYIAFVPVNGTVYKLDGMDAQPTPLGSYDASIQGSWLDVASPRITKLMLSAGDQDYSLLTVAQSPVRTLTNQLCVKHVTVQTIEARLDNIDSDWRGFIFTDGPSGPAEPPTPGLLSSLGASQEQLAGTTVPAAEKDQIEAAGLEELIALRGVNISDLADVQAKLMSEMDHEADQDTKARERQWDYGPVIQTWLEMLQEIGHAAEHLGQYRQD